MNIFRSLDELSAGDTPSVVTIGNFDGVHRGHRMVIDEVCSRARTLNARAVAITFDPHPAQVLRPGVKLDLLTPSAEKLRLLAETGLDAVLVLPFTEDFSRWTAHEFAQRVLCDALHAVEVHEGETFRFGQNAGTDVAGLAALGRQLGFAVHACSPLLLRGAAVSSSRIRRLLAAGEVSAARPLLGRSFSLHSTPASGRGFGSLYTVPTINLAPYPFLVPKDGVYITMLTAGGRGTEATTFRGVTNAGNRPTFGADSFAIETHLLNFKPMALHEHTPLELTFLHRLRDERRFDSPDELRTQIIKDVARAQRYFALCDG
jgi:riboflavin kinase/FMN adenylyltransferase